MQVTEVNDIKTYNLSHGRTIPEWLSDRKRRLLLRKDVDLRRRIQLIQDFDMPTVSNTVNISPDGQYIVATGIYKPRVRCYDVNQLALKFERGLDAQVVKCIILSEDYSKLLFLEEERYVELHSQFGFYYKTRIPRFGRDMAYNAVTCDALFVGAGPEIFRLNLEVGTYLKPFETGAVAGLNAVALNPVHNLLVTGSQEGLVEAWDTRVRERVATLDCAYDVVRTEVSGLASKRIPAVSTIAFRDDGLTMGVGTSGGQILLYDIRANRPHLTKDHMFGLPIKSIAYLDGPLNLVASLDSKIVKFWNRHTGAPYTAIQADRDLNGLAAYPHSGMFFLANESEKLLSYYIPSIGPAPRWCSFLDRITEELEESTENALYDDYKFVTEAELAEIGLSDLIGTNLLRAYMHGYFMDMRLYRKARDASQPFAYEEYRKAKIRERLEAERVDRVSVQDRLPKVNRALAERLLLDEEANAASKKSKSKKFVPNPLKDERFATIFTNPDFQVDELSEEFRLLNPVLSRMSKPEKADDGAKPLYADVFGEGECEGEISDSSEDSDDDLFSGGGGRAGAAAEDSEEEFSDDNEEDDNEDEDADLEDTRTDRKQQQQQKQQQKQQPAKQQQQQQPTKKPIESPPTSQITTKVYRMKSDTAYNGLPAAAQQDSKGKQRRVVNTAKQTFEQRLRSSEQQQQQSSGGSGESARLLHGGIGGNRVMTFTPSSSGREREAEVRNEAKARQLKDHLSERKRLARKAKGLKFSRKTFG